MLVALFAYGCCSSTSLARKIATARNSQGHIDELHRYIDALVCMGEDAVPGLIALLNNKDQRVHMLVFDVMERLQYPGLPWAELSRTAERRTRPRPERIPWLEPVIKAACEHESSLVRQVAVRVAPAHLGDASLPFLVEALNDRDPWVRTCALFSLGHLRAASGGELRMAIVWGITDPHAVVASAAMLAAAEHKLKRAVPLLVALLDDVREIKNIVAFPREVLWDKVPLDTKGSGAEFKPRVQELAAHCIQEITGRNFGFSTCYESRASMREIARRIRTALR